MPRRPGDLTAEERIRALSLICDTMYPPEDPARQWSPDTLEAISAVLEGLDLIPDLPAGDETFEAEDD